MAYTGDLRRLISRRDHSDISKVNDLKMIRNRITEFRKFKQRQLDGMPEELHYLIPSAFVISSITGLKKSKKSGLNDYKNEAQKELLKHSIERLDYYLEVMSDETLHEYNNEENDIELKINKGHSYLSRAQELFDRKKHNEAFMELRKACLYGAARPNIVKASYYMKSDVEEHRFLNNIMKG